MKSFRELVAQWDNFPNPDSPLYAPLMSTLWHLIDPTDPSNPAILGYVTDAVAAALETLPPSIRQHVTINSSSRTIALNATTPALRTATLTAITNYWHVSGPFPVLKKLRNEQIGIYTTSGNLYATIERAATPLFGIVSYYIYLIAYSRVDGFMKLWIQRRVAGKNFGNMLDCTVAGAIGPNESPLLTLERECAEEAGFGPEILKRVKAVSGGERTYNTFAHPKEDGGWVRSGCGWGFEVELLEGEKPTVVDGEAEGFYEMSVEEVKERLMNEEFMPSSAKVIIKWLVEKGEMNTEETGEILERKLKVPLAEA